MPSYSCGRCEGGPTGMTGHYGKVCHVTAALEDRRGVAALLDNPFHFCCPGDCQLLNADGTPKPAEEAHVEPDDLGDLIGPTATHCHEVREGDETPCPARPDEPHVDASGQEWSYLNDYADEEVNGCA